MIAEILATGDEIRTGALVDSNSAYISEVLETMGVSVVRHSCVGDDSEQLVGILREIGGRADVAVVTGGLGPTIDDLSAAAAARTLGVDLKLHAEALASIEAFFRKRKRPVTDSNRKQAFLPEGSECLLNPVGTAPGFALTIGRCRFFFLPGVPFEMRRMLSERVVPEIEALRGGEREHSRIQTIATFGLTESITGDLLDGLEARFAGVKLGLRAKFPEIQVKLYGRDRDAKALEDRIAQAAAWAAQRLGDKVVSLEGEPLQVVLGDLLRQRKATLAVAESCTGGLIAHWLTEVPGSSDYFMFSGVTYANAAKVNVLGVPAALLETHGAVHEETARAMAEGARRVSGATYGVATSGIAGPSGGTPEKPVGTVCIGVAGPEGTEAFRFTFPQGDRHRLKMIFAMTALDRLRRRLLGLEAGA